ncbi:MAG: YlbF family regulator [Bacillota bacterium]|nr:YlbF family regulator [Bacillota bacterium]
MQNVYDLAHELARSLKETDQYKDYKKYQEQVDANESLKKMIDDFNKQNFEVQTALMSGKEPDAELIEKVQKIYGIVMQDPTCAQYLNAQMAFSQVINDISQILGEVFGQ